MRRGNPSPRPTFLIIGGRLGDIYGVAVTATFVLNTVLFLAVARLLWGTAKWKLVLVGTLFLTVELAFFSANIAKVEHGAWLPLVIALAISLVMINWRRGQVVVTRNRIAKEGSLDDFLDSLPEQEPPLVRLPGVAIFLNPSGDTTPLALHAQVEHTHTLHKRVLIVSIDTVSIPHVDDHDRFAVEKLGPRGFNIRHVTIRNGYHDELNIPGSLHECRKQGLLERDLDLEASRLDRPTPLLKSEWVKRGALVIPYGTMSALELDLTDRMDKIVVDDRGQMLAGPFGALRPHINAGKVSPSTVHAEIGEICAGLRPGRTSESETILFWHRGLATSDIALAHAILEKAKRLGLGTSLDYR
jgi:hypothetical protein